MLGYTLEELNSLSPEAFLHLFHPNDQAAILKHMAEVTHLKKGEVSTIEYRFKSKHKGWVWCLSQDTGYEYDDDENMVSFVGSFIDITEKKQTETDLKKITASYQKLVEKSPLGMHFYTLDDEKRLIFTDANTAASQLLGIDNSQFIGKSIGEAFPPLLQTEVPGRYRDAAEHGVPWTTEQVSYEDENITGAYKIIAFQTSPGSMVAVFDDITERKKAEQAIQKSEELYRLLADTSTDMIARHNEAGVFRYVSPACRTLLGYEPEELIGHSAFEYFHPEDLAKLEENRKKIIMQPINTTVTFRFRKKNGEYTWLETNTHTVFEKETRAVLELHASSRDVSERVKSRQVIQRQNQLLREINSSKDKFFSLLSHDLRSPLSSSSQLLTLLHENIHNYSVEEIGHHIDLVSGTTNNLISLVDDVLLWANALSGRIAFNPQEANFSQVVRETIDIIKTCASAKNISINLVDTHNTQLFADVNMLKAILRNLLSNAIKFSNRGGQINIQVDQDEANTRISVIDYGIGMTPKVKAKLFDIAESSSQLGTEDEKGTGMGLIICKEFIDKHKGTIKVESNLGEGTTFTIELPNKQ
jgi:PAS domain S-box-containing protein